MVAAEFSPPLDEVEVEDENKDKDQDPKDAPNVDAPGGESNPAPSPIDRGDPLSRLRHPPTQPLPPADA